MPTLTMRYTGPAPVEKALRDYGCKSPFHVVRAGMMGEIICFLTTSPLEFIDWLWDGEKPVFESEAAVKGFYGVFLGMWNHLARHQEAGRPFSFQKLPLPRSGREFREALRVRLEETIIFMDCFLPDPEDPLPGDLRSLVDEMGGYMTGLVNLAEALPEAPGEEPVAAASLAEWKRCDAGVNRLAARLVRQAALERRAMLRNRQESAPRPERAPLRLVKSRR
ncbi:MAG: hypothetical protein AB1916_14865 [Thermodesulfobacteriota bacterium]